MYISYAPVVCTGKLQTKIDLSTMENKLILGGQLMKIKRETLLPGNYKSLTTLTQSPLQTKPVQKIGVWVQPTTVHTGVVDLKLGFGRGPFPCHLPICPTNRAKKPMAWPLLPPPLIVLTFVWRAQGRKRRQIWGDHPHRRAHGV